MSRIFTVLRSGAVGVAATLADLLVLTSLVELAHLLPAQANIPALIAGLIAQFVGNKYFAFRDTSKDLARQGAMFLAVEAGAFLLNAFLYDRTVALGVPYIAARLLVQMLVYFGFSFPLWSKIFTTARRS